MLAFFGSAQWFSDLLRQFRVCALPWVLGSFWCHDTIFYLYRYVRQHLSRNGSPTLAKVPFTRTLNLNLNLNRSLLKFSRHDKPTISTPFFRANNAKVVPLLLVQESRVDISSEYLYCFRGPAAQHKWYASKGWVWGLYSLMKDMKSQTAIHFPLLRIRDPFVLPLWP